MRREEFRKRILPLTPMEIELRDAPDRCAVVHKMLDRLYKKDADGLYVMTGTRMKEGAYRLLCHPLLRDRIRMLIHSRYETIPLHRTDFASITYVYSGHFTVTFPPPGRTIVLEKGQLMLMNAGVAHSFTVSGDDIVMSIQVEPAFANMTLIYGLDDGQYGRSSDNSDNSDNANSSRNGVFSFLTRMFSGQISAFSYMVVDSEDEERTRTLCEDLFCECIDPSMCSVPLVETYIRELFVLLMRSPSGCGTLAQDEADDVGAILRYIDTHYADCTLQELSDMFLLSPSYISSLIKQKTGKRFTDILKESRIKAARFYLHCSDLPISDISTLCGYTNRAFFYRTFEDLCGMTPLEWREGKQDSG